MKTIAVKENTFQMLDQLKTAEGATSFDELIFGITKEKLNVQESMFGALKGKIKPFTPLNRKNLWKDDKRLL